MAKLVMKYKGIDVAHHDGTIDWSKVKPEVDFAIIRMGYGSDHTGKKADGGQDDNEFANNIKGVIENNIPFAVYLFSYITHAENRNGGSDGAVENEIEHTKRLLKTIPDSNKPFAVYYSLSDEKTVLRLDKSVVTNAAEYFCYEIAKEGYRPGIYMSENGFKNNINLEEFNKINRNTFNASLWVGKFGDKEPDIGFAYDIWNYSETGTIPGINSKEVCLDKMTDKFGESIGLKSN